MKNFDMTSVSIDEHGCVALSDSDLLALEKEAVNVLAGAAYADLIRNSSCTNGSCAGTLNTTCTNRWCGGASNGRCSMQEP
ncbi:hypothetical protein [Massilia sp. CF038]|uniref:hypothetical protein n=1 Tax=Massilia sp. CF038 TaxID=1881045 RepID=UPI00091664A8|nr:hypothetical protein [Massilia sp. CF038]SHH62662.1 hypothetical protein SAMN05428948_4698 [Massilia sp. CF038]